MGCTCLEKLTGGSVVVGVGGRVVEVVELDVLVDGGRVLVVVVDTGGRVVVVVNGAGAVVVVVVDAGVVEDVEVVELAGVVDVVVPSRVVDVVVVGTVSVVLVVRPPVATQAQASVHCSPGWHPALPSHASPLSQSTIPSPHSDLLALKVRRTLTLGTISVPVMTEHPGAIVALSRTLPRRSIHAGQVALTLVPCFDGVTLAWIGTQTLPMVIWASRGVVPITTVSGGTAVSLATSASPSTKK